MNNNTKIDEPNTQNVGLMLVSIGNTVTATNTEINHSITVNAVHKDCLSDKEVSGAFLTKWCQVFIKSLSPCLLAWGA